MEKIALGVLHEVELYSNTDLDDFEAELFLNDKEFSLSFPLKRKNKKDSIYTFTIPESLGSLLAKPVSYKVYVYLDNARFMADEGQIQVVSKDNFTGAKLLNPATDKDVKFSAKINSSEKEEPEKELTKDAKEEEPKKEPKKDNKETPNEKKKVKESQSINEILQDVSQDEKPKNEAIKIDDIINQYKAVNDSPSKKGKSLREYAERVSRRNELAQNKDELNDRVKKILGDFRAK